MRISWIFRNQYFLLSVLLSEPDIFVSIKLIFHLWIDTQKENLTAEIIGPPPPFSKGPILFKSLPNTLSSA